MEKGIFKQKTINQIDSTKEILKRSSIQLAHDSKSSIWNSYFKNILFLPPPLIHNTEVLSTTTKESEEAFIIGIDIWNPKHDNTDRYESNSFINDYISQILNLIPDVVFHIKVTDANAKLNDFYSQNNRIKIYSFLVPLDYNNYLNDIDIYLSLIHI